MYYVDPECMYVAATSDLQASIDLCGGGVVSAVVPGTEGILQVQEDLTAHHGPELARGGRETVAGGSLTRGEDDRWDDVCSGIRTTIL